MIYELKDICSFIDYRGKTPEKTSEGIPLITAKIVKNGFLNKPTEFISKETYSHWMKRGNPQKGDIVFTTEAPLGEVALLKTDERLAFAQRVIIMHPDSSIVDNEYLFYALQDRQIKSKIIARSSGTTVIGIKASELKKVTIDLPPLKTQKKIAQLLSSLDGKIEVNSKINDNLQEQLYTIFESYYINSSAATNWKTGTFSDLMEKTINGDWGKEINSDKYTKAVYCIRGADIPVINRGHKGKMPIRYIKPNNLNAKQLTIGDIVIEASGGSPIQSTGRATVITQPFLERYNHPMIATNFCKTLKPIPGYSMFIYFYWQYLYKHGIFFLYENGTTGIKNLNISHILKSEIISIPDLNDVEYFNKLSRTYFSNIYLNGLECEILANTRNVLLSKLVSGKLDISKFEL